MYSTFCVCYEIDIYLLFKPCNASHVSYLYYCVRLMYLFLKVKICERAKSKGFELKIWFHFISTWNDLRLCILCHKVKKNNGCDRPTRDAYSSMAPDPTSDIFRDPCTPIIWFVFPIGLMRLITVRYFCHFIYTCNKEFKRIILLSFHSESWNFDYQYYVYTHILLY
jgi:hypothetical protein